MFDDEVNLHRQWKHCDTRWDLSGAIVERILRAARNAEFFADHHVRIIRAAIQRKVEVDILPLLVDMIVDPRDDYIIGEGLGRWIYEKDKISTDPAETLYGPLKNFIVCLLKPLARHEDKTLARHRVKACLISLRTVQKEIDYRSIVNQHQSGIYVTRGDDQGLV